MAFCGKLLLSKHKDQCLGPKQPLNAECGGCNGQGWGWVERGGSPEFAGQPVYQKQYARYMRDPGSEECPVGKG